MKTVLVIILLSSCFLTSQGQDKIDIIESTLKIPGRGEEVFYYGFEEGDQLVFSFEEVNGKELKEIEVKEYGGSSRFMDYKTGKIDEKILGVSKRGIIMFRFSNSALSGRVCKFKLQRIPESEQTANFNTTVFWKTVPDTSYKSIEENYLISSDTIVHNISDQVAKVHSSTNLNGNRTTFNFTLPPNTISWSYYVGVDQAGQQAFNRASEELASKAAPIVAKLPGYGPLAALALGSTSYIAQLQSGEDIDYFIVDNNNVNLFNNGQAFRYYKKGKVINDFSRMTAPTRGMYHFCLINDNAVTGVSVTIKVTAIAVNEVWGKRQVQKMEIVDVDVPFLQN